MKRRVLLALSISVAVFAIDQIAKLAAAAYHPSTYMLNPRTPSTLATLAVLGTMALVLTVPFRPALIAAAVWAGGAAGNMADAYFWPGGVPDFIRIGFVWGTWNLADAFITVGALGLGAALLTWLFSGAALRASADPRAQVAE